MSLSFTVLYQNVPRKVTCPNVATVDKLASLALEKFKLPSTSRGILYHSGKKLDGLTPLRYTSLVNNAKLLLSVESAPTEIQLKVLGNIHGQSFTKLVKTKPDVPLRELIRYVTAPEAGEIAWETNVVRISVLHTAFDSTLPDFDVRTVSDLIGTSSSAAMRLVVEDLQSSVQKKEAQTTQLSAMRKLEEYKRAKNLEASQAAKQEAEKSKPLVPDNSTKLGSRPTQFGKNSESFKEPQNLPSESPESASEPPHPVSSPEPPKAEPPAPEELPKEDLQPPEDTLYIALETKQGYTNPEEDYNPTLPQIEKYYNMLRSMQRKPATKTHRAISNYTVRIRFPDRTFLDLHMSNDAKLGQLVKKVELYIASDHIDSYTLRSGSPPFKKLAINFSENNAKLTGHPEFQEERVLLIWELTRPAPYLKDGVHTKDLNDMPEMVVDHGRAELEPDSEEAVKSGPSKKASKLGKGLPKWFRP